MKRNDTPVNLKWPSDELCETELLLLRKLVLMDTTLNTNTKKELSAKLNCVIKNKYYPNNNIPIPLMYIKNHSYCSCGGFSFEFHLSTGMIEVTDIDNSGDYVNIPLFGTHNMDEIPNRFENNQIRERYLTNVHFCSVCGKPIDKGFLYTEKNLIFCDYSEIFSWLDWNHRSFNWRYDKGKFFTREALFLPFTELNIKYHTWYRD